MNSPQIFSYLYVIVEITNYSSFLMYVYVRVYTEYLIITIAHEWVQRVKVNRKVLYHFTILTLINEKLMNRNRRISIHSFDAMANIFVFSVIIYLLDTVGTIRITSHMYGNHILQYWFDISKLQKCAAITCERLVKQDIIHNIRWSVRLLYAYNNTFSSKRNSKTTLDTTNSV